MSNGTQSIGQIAVPCGRLSCRKPVVQEVGPGRRKEFCSDTCRRGADREYKRAKAHVDVFEEYLRRSQHEVAAYGRRAEEGALTPEQRHHLESDARVALAQAATVVELGAGPDRALTELTALVAALQPLLGTGGAYVSRSA